ncbi:MAG: helix-turn-helix transcriptional regulator, partial [Bacilli bacterium]|nr:helix-turn-helix transcriptional regulator [Bacilli bacterium]
MELKELRLSKHLTQVQCAKIAGVSLRTYKKYESDSTPADSLRYKA